MCIRDSQELLRDPEIKREVEAHDVTALLSNPKITNLSMKMISDPEMFGKIMAVYRNQTLKQQAQNPQAAKP